MRLYKTSRWQRLRALQLKKYPCCALCEKEGYVKGADTVDHVIPHKGDEELFWDDNNLQSLCKQCHDMVKQRIEIKGYSDNIGVDGWPIDSNHPLNKRTEHDGRLH